jgi:hypothetical protein
MEEYNTHQSIKQLLDEMAYLEEQIKAITSINPIGGEVGISSAGGKKYVFILLTQAMKDFILAQLQQDLKNTEDALRKACHDFLQENHGRQPFIDQRKTAAHEE